MNPIVPIQQPVQQPPLVPAAKKTAQKLPYDVLHSIMNFSGAKELQKQDEVCKSWKAVASKPKIWEQLAKRSTIPITNPENAKKEVIAHLLQLPEVNNVFRALKGVPPVVLDPFEDNNNIRTFVRENLKTEKFESLLIPFALELFEKLKGPSYKKWDRDLRALQLLLDEGVPLRLPKGQPQDVRQYEQWDPLIFYINYAPGFEEYLKGRMNFDKIYSTPEEITLGSCIQTAIRHSNLPFVKFLLEKVKANQWEVLLQQWINNSDIFENISETMSHFIVSQCREISPTKLDALLDKCETEEFESCNESRTWILSPTYPMNPHLTEEQASKKKQKMVKDLEEKSVKIQMGISSIRWLLSTQSK